MDVVYIFKEDAENNSEDLRYSLRSLQNLPHNKDFIAGDKPAWATNIRHIPVAQMKTKSENWSMNLSATVKSLEVSDNFLMMNDDFFIMKKLSTMPNLNMGMMADVITLYKQRYPEGSTYIDKMCRLYEILKLQGYDNPVSYELHTPMILSKQKVIDFYSKMQGQQILQFRTYYGNYYNLGGEPVEDVKIFLDNKHNSPDYTINPEQYLTEQVFISSTGGAFKKGLVGDFIRKSFPNKSIYEV